MLSMTTVQPAARQMIESQLRSRIAAEANTKDVSAGQTRVASLLNELDKAQLDEVIQDLEETGSVPIAEIRARLFSFEDIPQLGQKSRVALFDGLSTELVTLALRGAAPDVADAVLSALGPRSRRMIEAELGAAVDVQPDAVARARKTIAATALRLSRDGAVELPSMDNAA
jgi:flagellar motor switch protein FliG